MNAPAVEASAYRQNIAFVERLQTEVEYEYTSKERLRNIARQALATLHAGYVLAADAAEAAAQTEAESSGLLVPPTGLVTP